MRAATALKTEPKAEPRAKVSARVQTLVADRLATKAKIDELTAGLKEIDADLLAAADDAGGSIETDDWTLRKVDSHSSSISKERLVSLGVSLRIIRRATVEREYSYARIDVAKGKKNSERP
jgi:hypothetical protein